MSSAPLVCNRKHGTVAPVWVWGLSNLRKDNLRIGPSPSERLPDCVIQAGIHPGGPWWSLFPPSAGLPRRHGDTGSHFKYGKPVILGYFYVSSASVIPANAGTSSFASLKSCAIRGLAFTKSLLFEVFRDAKDAKETQRTQRKYPIFIGGRTNGN